MDGNLINNMAGAAFAVGVCVVGVWYLWGHATRRRYAPDDLITIAEFSNATDAEMWKMRLQSQGIECTLVGETTVNLLNPMLARTDLGAIRLQVLGRDIGRARKVIGAS